MTKYNLRTMLPDLAGQSMTLKDVMAQVGAVADRRADALARLDRLGGDSGKRAAVRNGTQPPTNKRSPP